MMRHGKNLSAQVEFYNDSVSFYLADFDRDQRRMAKIEYEEAADGAYTPPSFALPMGAAQELFEQMWSQGFRSKHDSGGADKLDAARLGHIADLRKAAKLA